MISWQEKWIKIARLDEDNKILFEQEFLDIVGEMGWGVKQLVGHLLTDWEDPMEHLLDSNSPYNSCTDNQPGGPYNCNGLFEPQDIVEYICVKYANDSDSNGKDFSPQWHKDILRAKLVSLRIPEKLLREYVESYNKIVESIPTLNMDEIRARRHVNKTNS